MNPQRIEMNRQIQGQTSDQPMSHLVESRVNKPVWNQVRRDVSYLVLDQLHEATREATTN